MIKTVGQLNRFKNENESHELPVSIEYYNGSDVGDNFNLYYINSTILDYLKQYFDEADKDETDDGIIYTRLQSKYINNNVVDNILNNININNYKK